MMYIPRSFSSLIVISCTVLPESSILYSVLIWWPMCVTLHFSGWNLKSHVCGQDINLFRSSCRPKESSLVLIRHQTISMWGGVANVINCIQFFDISLWSRSKKTWKMASPMDVVRRPCYSLRATLQRPHIHVNNGSWVDALWPMTRRHFTRIM